MICCKRKTLLQTKEDSSVILAIPIFQGMSFFVAWHVDPMGLFSVKSTYATAVKRRDHLNHEDAEKHLGP